MELLHDPVALGARHREHRVAGRALLQIGEDDVAEALRPHPLLVEDGLLHFGERHEVRTGMHFLDVEKQRHRCERVQLDVFFEIGAMELRITAPGEKQVAGVPHRVLREQAG
jgi:hypothetical protein